MPAPMISDDELPAEEDVQEEDVQELDVESLIRVLQQIRANTEEPYIQGVVDGVICLIG